MHDHHQIRDALIGLAGRLGISVREAPLGGDGGGLCTIKGDRVLYFDRMSDVVTQVEKALADLAQLSEIDTVFVEPWLREALDRHRD